MADTVTNHCCTSCTAVKKQIKSMADHQAVKAKPWHEREARGADIIIDPRENKDI